VTNTVRSSDARIHRKDSRTVDATERQFVLKRYFVLVIALITAVVVGTATSTSAMQPQSKSTQSMHTKTSSKKKTNRIQSAGADVG
jgi:capsular polysaccharide biosynthesis protein